ncbi:cell filamentation protein Fic [Mycobacterium sp. CBMA 213]|uniref:Adenosine monophosphate-protein transferase NmFic n=1 Tax=Mycolicibacterium sp. CBMA 213 TaxID=1968788 RepID=A0A343VRB9_9MYCO|nr:MULTISPECIES: Fic family protein [unclassified Mycolicibacterium]AVN58443.1 Adenosine monophosphate-protein transferase NmFic [Mycolicibacterium sp. CBMA 213]MUL61100.1 cell filamentation protein Fic [Mycolicibacterium sp. CBMA 335]MUM03337.1 cell filamentation protein Fic [Mycolicibacterium sp. CBMA 213]
MPLAPGYGETPIPGDELAALLPHVIDTLAAPITRADIYDLESAVLQEVTETQLGAAADGSLTLDDLLNEYFLRDLHTQIYGDIWTWAGRWRQREVNIGVAPEQIAVELRSAMGNIRYRWEHTADWTPRHLGIAAHAETVRVHPFTDGNGRTTRLLADLVFVAVQDEAELQYDWDIDKRGYIEHLREFDRHRNVTDLAAFIGIHPIED